MAQSILLKKGNTVINVDSDRAKYYETLGYKPIETKTDKKAVRKQEAKSESQPAPKPEGGV